MAHFAKLDENNIVTDVIVVNNEVVQNLPFPDSEPMGVAFCQSLLGQNTIWKQTSYNNNFRKNFAGIGFTYDMVKDAFIAPKPYDSWVLDETTCSWTSPVPYPTDNKRYYWDEGIKNWVEILD